MRLLGGRRLEQQCETVGIMKIRLVGPMAKRPIREPIARFDDRREPEADRRARMDRRQCIEPDTTFELKPVV